MIHTLLLFWRIVTILKFDMRFFTYFCACVFIVALPECHSSHEAQSSGSPESSGIGSPVQSSGHLQPNVIQQNVSVVEATIDTVILDNEIAYHASVLVRSASGKENSEAAEGEHLNIRPQFALTGDPPSVEPGDPKNKGLLRLRMMKRGDAFSGKISLGQDGIWNLLEVEDH